jgi:zinc protease
MSDLCRSDIFVLENGLQVIAVERPYGKVFAAALTYGVGSFDDLPGTPGIAHFVEHLAFHGPNKELAEKLAECGADVNAYTGYEHTEFQVSGHIDQIESALELLGNAVRNPPVTEESISSERDVCIHELFDAAGTNPREAHHEAFWRQMLGDPNWQIKYRTMSRRKMKRLTLQRVNEFKREHYHPDHARLAIVSSISCAELRKLVRCALNTDAPAGNSPANQPERYLAARVPVTISIDRHAYIWLEIIQAVRNTDAVTRLSADMIGHLVGGGPHSDMFRHLRAERSIAYDTRADDYAYLNGTAVSFFCSIHRRYVQEALHFIMGRLKRIAEQGMTAEEFENERVRMIRWHELSMDNPCGLASYLAFEALRPPADALIQENDYVQRVNALTLPAVNQAAAKLLLKANRATFVAGRLGPLARMRIRSTLQSG